METLQECVEYLFKNRAKNLAPSAFADILDRLIWCMDDNGKEISKLQIEWLRSNDRDKVEIALHMDEVSPFMTKVEMLKELTLVANRFPELKGKSDKVMSEWSQILPE